jgi:hypothetical protein
MESPGGVIGSFYFALAVLASRSCGLKLRTRRFDISIALRSLRPRVPAYLIGPAPRVAQLRVRLKRSKAERLIKSHMQLLPSGGEQSPIRICRLAAAHHGRLLFRLVEPIELRES